MKKTSLHHHRIKRWLNPYRYRLCIGVIGCVCLILGTWLWSTQYVTTHDIPPPPQVLGDMSLSDSMVPPPFPFDTWIAQERPAPSKEPVYSALPSIHQNVPPTNVTPVPIKGHLAIILDDMGVAVSYSTQAIKTLPKPITLSFLSYAPHINAQVKDAMAYGHEVMLHLPMEAINKNEDPGPMALYTDLSPLEIQRRLTWHLNQFQGWIGVNNHMGSKFTSSLAHLVPVIQAIKPSGAFFLDSKTISGSKGCTAAKIVGVPCITRDIFLDDTDTTAHIMVQLKRLEDCGLKRGSCIAIGHPRPKTLAALQEWLPTVNQKGLKIVPISHLIPQPHPYYVQKN
jgi:uncharacterized protein